MMFFAMFLVVIAFMISLVGLVLLITGIIFLILHVVKKRKTKKGKSLLIISLVLIIISLPITSLFPVLLSVEATRRDVPSKITYKGKEYVRGFYEDLNRDTVSYNGKSFIIKFKRFYKVNNDMFDMIYSPIESAEGILYCEKSRWEQAKAYYSDNSNFSFYYKKFSETVDESVALNNPDIDKFNRLHAFMKENKRSETGNNEHLNLRKIPYSDYHNAKALGFYKTSKDNLFSTDKAFNFYLIKGKLVYYISSEYDHENIEKSYYEVVDVPEEIASYFIDLAGT